MSTRAELEFAREDDVIPDDVRLVRDLLNTNERQTGRETLLRPSNLDDWIVVHRLASEPIGADDADVERVHAIREGLREVLLGHAGHTPDPAAIASLDEALASVPLHVTFRDPSQPLLVSATARPVDVALGGVIAAMHRSIRDQTWGRLKACDRATCRWAYYDHSRNRSARWCTMAGCGNALKMKRAYTNRKAKAVVA